MLVRWDKPTDIVQGIFKAVISFFCQLWRLTRVYFLRLGLFSEQALLVVLAGEGIKREGHRLHGEKMLWPLHPLKVGLRCLDVELSGEFLVVRSCKLYADNMSVFDIYGGYI